MTTHTDMTSTDDQKQINEREWANPDNWSSPSSLSVYFSKKDTRTWVPKQKRMQGWTLNLGRTGGVLWLFFIIVLVAIAPLAVAAVFGGLG